jgi:hypothetical protein
MGCLSWLQGAARLDFAAQVNVRAWPVDADEKG